MHSIEPTGIGARAHGVGAVAVITGVHGALAPHRYSQHETTGSFIRLPGFAACEDMVWKLHASSEVPESVRATAPLAVSPPSGNTAPFGAQSQTQALDGAPRCAAKSSHPVISQRDPFSTSLGVNRL